MSKLSFDMKDRVCLFFQEKYEKCFPRNRNQVLRDSPLQSVGSVWVNFHHLKFAKTAAPLCLDSSEICNLEAENHLCMTWSYGGELTPQYWFSVLGAPATISIFLLECNQDLDDWSSSNIDADIDLNY